MPVTGLWRSFVLPRPAKKLCSGWDTCAVVLEPSEHDPYNVVMWGRADHGQLACDVGAKYSRELVTVRLANIIDLVCGSNHSIARTSDGMYLWGWNEHGNAGDPSLRDVYEPLELTGWPQGADTVVAGIGCGYGNSYIMLDKLSNVTEAHPDVAIIDQLTHVLTSLSADDRKKEVNKTKAVYAFQVTNAKGKHFFVVDLKQAGKVTDGASEAEAAKGQPKPDITITIDDGTFVKISEGKTTAAGEFMSGK
ncbi:hypothetical protein GGH18_005498, partial [Coemansia sp. RSA 530]